jgi:[acyl-carrier-protein] S-malonyltransferase
MVNWETTAFIFPGQGSQEVSMGKDFAETYALARETFEQADDILGFPLSQMCWNGTEEELNQTINTQPALFVTSIAILRVLQQESPMAKPAWVAGHSMGELTALTAAGAISFEDGVKLVRTRGRLMQQAGDESPGAMAALLALDSDKVNELCASVSEETGKIVVLANDNCPGQIVVSGENEAIDRIIEVAPDAGARRAVKLAVSIAAHSPLMASASESFVEALAATNISEPQIPVYGNVTAAPLKTASEIREELNHQLTRSVLWTDSMQGIITAGAETFVEIGSKDVLSGLMKRIDRKKARVSLNSVEALTKFLSE